ncbi:flagellar assembly protein FliH [Amphritea sp. 1_MG-2023]|uniref:flagellar assembly protein FliH n=1 Tax=Amphritea sp. 1_MG-2023 TaxID=3062670 RepID=UPI0026E25097|nr:flagellar assembly protein FliH [Amphritea sp. 1_MG-2023]MDO6564682.1 flagellar assembly protein FliH [Amphritea sp. 1_MG-2023]
MQMKAIDKSVIRIRAEDARAAALWTLPVVQGEHVVGLQQKPAKEVEEETIEEVADGRLRLSELEKIREDAYQEGLQQGRDEGLQQGLEEGRAKGHTEGLAAAQAEIETQVALLHALQQQLDRPLQQVSVAVEQLLVGLITELSEAVIGAQIELDSTPVIKAVEDAIAQLPQTGADIKVILHPDDVPVLEPLLALHESWSLVEEASMTRGGCKVVSGYGLLDNSVERRFDAAVSQLRRALTQMDAEAVVSDEPKTSSDAHE